MSTIPVGKLTATPTHFQDSLTLADASDVYQFTIEGAVSTNVNVAIHDKSGNALNTPSIRLFADSNHNGKFDSGDQLTGLDVAGVGLGVDRSVNQLVTPGTYFAEVSPRFANTTEPYSIDLSTTAPKQPENLIAVTLNFGDLNSRGISHDEINQRISNSNTSDFYAVSVRNNQTLDISLTGLSADADLRVINDKNHNNIVDADEVITGSVHDGNNPESVTLSAPGDYLIQVYQFEGSTNYNLGVTAQNH